MIFFVQRFFSLFYFVTLYPLRFTDAFNEDKWNERKNQSTTVGTNTVDANTENALFTESRRISNCECCDFFQRWLSEIDEAIEIYTKLHSGKNPTFHFSVFFIFGLLAEGCNADFILNIIFELAAQKVIRNIPYDEWNSCTLIHIRYDSLAFRRRI